MSNKVDHRSSKADMLQYAAEELGVKLDETKERSEIWAEIKEIDASLAEKSATAPTGEEHLLENETAKPSSKGSTKKPKRAARVMINLHQPAGSDDPEVEPDSHVVVGVNGVNYQLEIGKDLPVPYAVYDVLRNAKQKKYYRKKNALTNEVETVSKEVLRHPFTVIRELS